MSEQPTVAGRPRGRLERLIGGSLLGVIVRLALASLLVGIVMSVLGLHPMDVVIWFERRLAWLTDLSFETVRRVFGYFLMGAAIVVPVWIIWRIFRISRI